MTSEFIKVSQGDSKNQIVDVKNIKPINNIKVIRPEESEYSSSESSVSSYSSEEEAPKKKKTKKILRKKEQPNLPRRQERDHDFSMFSNPKKISQQKHDSSESEYSDESSEMGESETSDESRNNNSFEEKQKMKQDLLIKISALEKKGFEFTKKFNMTSNYEEMMFEYEKIKKFIETQAGIKFARRCLMACVTGVEFLNKKFDPFSVKLEGWSENVMENVDDYDNIFEKLHEKYSSKAEVSPELELLLTLGGSAFMFHLTNSLLKSPAMSNVVAQNNPNFMASMMGAMSQGMKEMGRPPAPQAMPQNGNGNINGFPAPIETRGIRKEMRGPMLDQNLFSGTPLASNHPNNNFNQNKPNVQNFNEPTNIRNAQNFNEPTNIRNAQNFNERYYEEDPINDDDRFSIASSSDDSSISTISLGSTVKTLKINKNVKGKGKGNGGFELNIK